MIKGTNGDKELPEIDEDYEEQYLEEVSKIGKDIAIISHQTEVEIEKKKEEENTEDE